MVDIIVPTYMLQYKGGKYRLSSISNYNFNDSTYHALCIPLYTYHTTIIEVIKINELSEADIIILYYVVIRMLIAKLNAHTIMIV